MDKIVKVCEGTHKRLKIGAANSDLSIKDFVYKLAINNINGIPFDVEVHKTDDLIAVFADIAIEMSRRYDSMDRKQIDDYKREIENIPFSE